VAAVVGGSMGGMSTLEWPLCTPLGYVKAIIPIATSADHNAWGVSWAEAQRQCIYADPAFMNGRYIAAPETQPKQGLSAARMVAMLTYRSSPSFDTRFGRKAAGPKNSKIKTTESESGIASPPSTPETSYTDLATLGGNTLGTSRSKVTTRHECDSQPTFAAQSYLQYQGQKFLARFDANCYIHLTRKMDLHDVSRGRLEGLDLPENDCKLSKVFKNTPSGALVVGVASDMLFTVAQQEVLADSLPDAELTILSSPEGHDGFLLEFEVLGNHIIGNLKKQCPWVYEGELIIWERERTVIKNSVFGEVESGW
jgi:homoserine O-acetyltransferase/O-succinyltransferase